jgi:hypothetical protein
VVCDKDSAPRLSAGEIRGAVARSGVPDGGDPGTRAAMDPHDTADPATTAPRAATDVPGATTRTAPRSLSEQSVEEMGGPLSILTLQKRDHERLDRLMAEARRTEAEGGRAHRIALRKVARLVFTHAFAEEAVLFPAARAVLAEGDELTVDIEEEHQDVDEVMTALDRSDPTDPNHGDLVRRAFASLDRDVRDEEDVLLPRMQARMTTRQLQLLGLQWQLLRATSPTRPHPVVSRRPPGQVLSALPLTFLDRLRDQVQRVDEVTGGRASAPLDTVDRALAGAAGAVERMPIIRTGDRPETSR